MGFPVIGVMVINVFEGKKMEDVKRKFWIFLSNVIVIGDFVENY
jgi:hypothetical protein